MPPPDRWELYQPLGTVIPGTKFIAFKVPLKEALCKNLPSDQCFSPSILIQTLKNSGYKLGLVVDLTFTYKYYNGLEFTKNSIEYEKIFTAGHDVPSEDVYLRFGEIVDGFMERNRDALIGVHCTHGVNRTGYLLCRYMIEKLKMKPEEAISKFNKSRGHPLERTNYIEDLKTRPQKGGPSKQEPESSSTSPEMKKKASKRKLDSLEPPAQNSTTCKSHKYTSIHHERQGARSIPKEPNVASSKGSHKGNRSNNQYISPLAYMEEPPALSWGRPAMAYPASRMNLQRGGNQWHSQTSALDFDWNRNMGRQLQQHHSLGQVHHQEYGNNYTRNFCREENRHMPHYHGYQSASVNRTWYTYQNKSFDDRNDFHNHNHQQNVRSVPGKPLARSSKTVSKQQRLDQGR